MHDIELWGAIIITVFTRFKFESNQEAPWSFFITVAPLHSTVNFLSEKMCTCCFCLDALLSGCFLLLRVFINFKAVGRSRSARRLTFRELQAKKIQIFDSLCFCCSHCLHLHHYRCGKRLFSTQLRWQKSLQRFKLDHKFAPQVHTVLIICTHIGIDTALKHSIIDKISQWQLIKWAGDTTVSSKWRLEDKLSFLGDDKQ